MSAAIAGRLMLFMLPLLLRENRVYGYGYVTLLLKNWPPDLGSQAFVGNIFAGNPTWLLRRMGVLSGEIR